MQAIVHFNAQSVVIEKQLSILSVPQPFWGVRLLAIRRECEADPDCTASSDNAEMTVCLRESEGAANPCNLMICCRKHDPIKNIREVDRRLLEKKPPRTHAARERLRQFLEKEPDRLRRHFYNLLAVYREAFGPEAGDAFEKALKARHAGVEVVAETRRPPRISSALPVPKPLPSAVAASDFGQEENGKPVTPSREEVRAITEEHAERITQMLTHGDQQGAETAVKKYAESFGDKAARQLAAHARRGSFRSDAIKCPHGS